MKRKILLALMLIVLSILAFGFISASAETEGIYSYIVSNGEAVITDCDTSASGEIVIPSTIDGYPVTSIDGYAFYLCKDLTKVTIPDGVSNIGYGAFLGCINLESVVLSDTIEYIGVRAFGNCSSLTFLDIPDSVKTIDSSAFEYCNNLTNVVMGTGVTDIEYDAFSGCNIKRVDIKDIKAWCNIDFGYYINYSSNPASCAGGFYYNNEYITNLVIPDGTTSIGSGAFAGCGDLISVTIPASVASIKNDAFASCTGLNKVNITNIDDWCEIDFGGYTANPLSYADKLYLNDTLVTNLVVSEGVISLSDSAFYGCSSITSVTLPDSVTNIGDVTFCGCENLTNVTIGNELTSIGSKAFYECRNLTSVTFLRNEELSSIMTTASETKIGDYAFGACSSLINVTLSDGVKSIGDGAFYGCSGLASVNIPNTVITIGYNAFGDCHNLIQIIIPDSVTSIGDSAFFQCSNLISVTIGSGINTICEQTFYNCRSLKYVCLPIELQYVKNDAFNECSNIETVFYEGNESQWNEILFYNRNENLVNTKVVYNATKKTYKFETNCNIKINDITNYAIFCSPIVKNEGKSFIGWHDNVSLSGEPITFPYYGNATTLYAAWTDRTGKSFDDALTAKENQQYTVTTTESGQIIYYEFVPKYTGEYRFYSTGSYDTYGYLYNSSRNQITYNDDAGDGNNFYIERELTAGETYYIGAKVYSGTGTFTLHVETDCIPGTKTVCVTASSGEKIFISIPSYLQENSQVILACYKNDKFVEMETASNKNETIYFVINHEFDTAKVMVWESFENLKPLCEVEVIQ